MVNETVMEIVRRYLERLQSEGLPVSRAILFGSHARGTASEDSDIDLILLSPAFDHLTWEQESRAWEIAKAIDWRIEPVLCGESTYTTNDWHPLIDISKREGFEVRSAAR